MKQQKVTTVTTGNHEVKATKKGAGLVLETSKKEAPPEKAPRLVFDEGKDETKVFFQQGPVKFLIAGDDLWKTLGAGPFLGEGAFDKLNDQQVKNWAEAAGLPTTPFSRELLKPVLNGILQETWYHDIQEEVPESCIKYQAERVRTYLESITRFAKTGNFKKESGEGSGKGKSREHHFKAQAQSVYRLMKGFKVELKGQQAVLLAWFKKNPAGGYRTQIVRDLEADGFRANQPVDRVVAYYLNTWSKAGWLERIGEQMPIAGAETPAKAAPEQATEETPAAVQPPAETPAAKSKKATKKSPAKTAAKPPAPAAKQGKTAQKKGGKGKK